MSNPPVWTSATGTVFIWRVGRGRWAVVAMHGRTRVRARCFREARRKGLAKVRARRLLFPAPGLDAQDG